MASNADRHPYMEALGGGNWRVWSFDAESGAWVGCGKCDFRAAYERFAEALAMARGEARP